MFGVNLLQVTFNCFVVKGAGDDSQIVLCELGLSTSTKTNPKTTYVFHADYRENS